MRVYKFFIAIVASMMMLSSMIDATPLPFTRAMVSGLKNSLGHLGSIAKQIHDERADLAMDRSLDTDSVEYLEKELKHLKAIDYILGARDRMMEIMHPDNEGIIKYAAGTNH